MSLSTDDTAASISEPDFCIIQRGVLQIWAPGVGGFDSPQVVVEYQLPLITTKKRSWVDNVSHNYLYIVLFHHDGLVFQEPLWGEPVPALYFQDCRHCETPMQSISGPR